MADDTMLCIITALLYVNIYSKEGKLESSFYLLLYYLIYVWFVEEMLSFSLQWDS